jgi:uncharacterized protein YjgD (DUF1641 family)
MMTETARRGRKRRERETSQEQMEVHRISHQRISELLTALDRRGLLEAAKGALEDEDTFSELMRFFSSDEALTIIQNAKPIIQLLSALDYLALRDLAVAAKDEKQAVAGFKSLLRLVSALEARGLVEPLVGFLNDEKTFAYFTKLLSSDSALLMINNLQNLTMLSNALDPEFLSVVDKAVEASKRKAKPVKGLWGVLHELGDPAVAAGLGRVFEVLRVIGEDTLTKK